MLLEWQPHSVKMSLQLSNLPGRYRIKGELNLWHSSRATFLLLAGCCPAVCPAGWPPAGGLGLGWVGPQRVGGLEEAAWHQLWWECEMRSHTLNLLRQLLKGKTDTEVTSRRRLDVFCRMMCNGGSSGSRTSGWLTTTITDFSWAWGRSQWLWTNTETWWGWFCNLSAIYDVSK